MRRTHTKDGQVQYATKCPHTDRLLNCKGMCRSCYDKQHRIENHAVIRARERRYREKHFERNQAARRLWWRKKQGITSPETKSGNCDICGGWRKRLCFDHDHATMWHRGWLCHGCNLRLGWYDKHKGTMLAYLNEANLAYTASLEVK